MNKTLLGSVTALATAAALLAAPSPVSAGDTECVGILTGAHDNVVVPSGAVCILSGATVAGNVKALEDSRLLVAASTVRGDVEGDKASEVRVQFESQVGGNVAVKGADEGSFNAVDINVRVAGDVQFEENRGVVFIDAALIAGSVDVVKNAGRVEVEFNAVGGNVKVEDNVIDVRGMSVTGNQVMGNMGVFKNIGDGAKQVVANTVGQNLQCFDNTPPFLGGPNMARDAEGQCF